jgi:hypothetical protein
MDDMITFENAQQESAKHYRDVEELLSNVSKNIKEASQRGAFTTVIKVSSFEDLEKIKEHLSKQPFKMVWARTVNNLYFLKIYWGPNPKIKKLNDPKVEKSWNMAQWKKKKKKTPVINPETKKPMIGVTWKE